MGNDVEMDEILLFLFGYKDERCDYKYNSPFILYIILFD